MAALLFVAGGALMAETLAVHLRGGTAAEALVTRNIVLAAAFGAAAIDLSPRLWFPAGFGVVAALVGSAWPEQAELATLGTLALSVAAIVWESMRPWRAVTGDRVTAPRP